MSRRQDILLRGNLAFGKGVYGATEALKLINYRRERLADFKPVSRMTVGRWLKGYDYESGGERRHSNPLWQPEYATGDQQDFEVGFRDLIELRFVKAFRDLGLGLQTIRACFDRAIELVDDPRPFSTQKFRTDGRSIFLEITSGLDKVEVIDVKRRQRVFATVVAPSFKDLEFDADVVTRWFPLGSDKKSVVIDPKRCFGRPIVGPGIPTSVLLDAVKAEGSVASVARLYEISPQVVRDAEIFEAKLAA